MKSTTTLSRTQEARTEEARKRLFSAALQLFAAKGYEQTTLADISVQAGYSRALAQYHFGSKQALAQHILEILGERDMQLALLPCEEISGELAWQKLLAHMDASWKNLSYIHSDCDRGVSARGEMLLRAAATYSPDSSLRNLFSKIGRQLTQRVSFTLEQCRRDGIIGADVDTDAAAAFYVMSIWGLLSALYVDPKAAKVLDSSFDMLRQFIKSLHVEGQT